MDSKNKIVAYYRVSTKRQSLGLDAQRARVQQYASMNSMDIVGEYSEKESGKDNDRQQLNKAVELCKKCGFTLVVAKLDRLSRDTEFLVHMYNDMQKGGCRFVALDMPNIGTDIMTFSIYASLAQKERELISERTSKAIRAKIANGEQWAGSRNIQTEYAYKKGLEVRQRNAMECNRKYYLLAMSLKPNARNMSDLARMMNEYTTTRNGKQWTCQHIKRLLSMEF